MELVSRSMEVMVAFRDLFRRKTQVKSTGGSDVDGLLGPGPGDWETREQALVAMGTNAVEPLIAILRTSANLQKRIRAISALQKIKDARAVEPLLRALQDSDTAVALFAQDALIAFRPHAAAEALKGLGATAVELLAAALRNDNERVDTERSAVFAALTLSYLGDVRAVEPLIEALGHSEDQVRAMAAFVLGQFRDPRALEPLRATRGSDRVNKEVREACEKIMSADKAD